uniref:Uncharacterized protein n=1 Tax=Nelumbo nucifera TaxID=4432 RepID=A0A822ZDC7_NELNU|nr:TPA_asm: hypothetical protein HUJ06_015802 [Nelumbo nucifera]
MSIQWKFTSSVMFPIQGRDVLGTFMRRLCAFQSFNHSF